MLTGDTHYNTCQFLQCPCFICLHDSSVFRGYRLSLIRSFIHLFIPFGPWTEKTTVVWCWWPSIDVLLFLMISILPAVSVVVLTRVCCWMTKVCWPWSLFTSSLALLPSCSDEDLQFIEPLFTFQFKQSSKQLRASSDYDLMPWVLSGIWMKATNTWRGSESKIWFSVCFATAQQAICSMRLLNTEFVPNVVANPACLTLFVNVHRCFSRSRLKRYAKLSMFNSSMFSAPSCIYTIIIYIYIYIIGLFAEGL